MPTPDRQVIINDPVEWTLRANATTRSSGSPEEALHLHGLTTGVLLPGDDIGLVLAVYHLMLQARRGQHATPHATSRTKDPNSLQRAAPDDQQERRSPLILLAAYLHKRMCPTERAQAALLAALTARADLDDLNSVFAPFHSCVGDVRPDARKPYVSEDATPSAATSAPYTVHNRSGTATSSPNAAKNRSVSISETGRKFDNTSHTPG